MSNEHTKVKCTHPEGCCECCTDDPARVKDSWLWIKDAKGFGSVTVTFTTIAFFVTTLAYLASIFLKVGKVEFRQFDVAACSAYFIPILTLYFSRKYTEAKFNTNATPPTAPVTPAAVVVPAPVTK